MLPEENNIFRVDDIQELSLYFEGDDDNNFEQNEKYYFMVKVLIRGNTMKN